MNDTKKIKCPHCNGKGFFRTLPQHPKGAGVRVHCSKCHGERVVEVPR